MPALSKDCPKRRAESDPEGEPPIKKLELLHLGPTAAFQDDQEKKQDELTGSDNMLLDDTAHTSYIYNIEQELASIEAQEKLISFLPDIEKTLNAVPRSLLKEPKPDNELVLYRVPRSLTVAEEDQDSVRKAIIESRARVRARQSEARQLERSARTDSTAPSPFYTERNPAFEAGDDMDVDL